VNNFWKKQIPGGIGFFILAVLVSWKSAHNVSGVGALRIEEFYPDLFGLHLFSWIFIYALVMGVVWYINKYK
jgi:hypothetical protein